MISRVRSSEPVLKAENIWVVYSDGTIANKGVSMEVYPGEIHGLLGENGAGKTSFVGAIYGVVRPTVGKIYVDGGEVVIRRPADARKHGIFLVPQHNVSIPRFTGRENILLAGGEPVLSKAEEIIASLGISIDIDTPVERLERGLVKKIEVVRALATGAKVLILDEPTSVMSPLEAAELLKMLRGLREMGYSFIYITHRLDEVFEVCDRVTVLKDGVVTYNGPPTSIEELEQHMFREVSAKTAPPETLENLHIVLGVEGNGQEAMARRLVMGGGFTGYVPSNPVEAIVPGLDLVDNVRFRILDYFDLDPVDLAKTIIRRYDVVARDVYTDISRLSGGNIQRFVVGRELELSRERCVLMYPSRGLDTRSSKLIHMRVREAAERGCETYFFTEDVEEAIALGGLVRIIYRGRLSEEYPSTDLDPDWARRLMSGVGWSG